MNNSAPLNNERPLVTFALFAYNQEKYIREAIEGAFSQTYEPLEIILSDDCSSDLTFEIMQQMAAEYKGPHNIIARRNISNLGTVDHVLTVAKIAKGQLVAVGAGDDIAVSHRIDRQVDFWKKNKTMVVVSDYILIDDNANILKNNYSPYMPIGLAETVFKIKSGIDIHGASAMYDSKIFEVLSKFKGRYYFEDSLLNFTCYWLGSKVMHLKEPLVKYRTHSNSLSNSFHEKHSFLELKDKQVKAASYVKNKKDLFDAIYSYFILNNSSSTPVGFVYDEFFTLRKRFHILGGWIEMGFISRIYIFILNYKNKDIRKFLFPRLLGLNVFILMKKFLKK